MTSLPPSVTPVPSSSSDSVAPKAVASPGSRRAAFAIGLVLMVTTVSVMVWRVRDQMRHMPGVLSGPVEPTQTGRYLAARIAYNSGALKESLQYTRDALKLDPDNRRLQEHAYRTALFSGDYDSLLNYASKLPADAEPGLPSTFVQAIAAFKTADYAKAESSLNGLPPKGFSAAFQPIMREWAKVGQKTLTAPAEIPAFALRAGELALLMTYHVALINEQAGYKDTAAENYATLQKNAEVLPNRIAQGLVNYLQRTGKQDEAVKVVSAHRGTHPDAPLFLYTEQKIEPMVRTPADGVAEVLYGMASIFAGMQANAEATAHLRLALMLRPDMDVAQYMLGMLQEQSKHAVDAIETYNLIKPNDALYRRAQLRSAVVEYTAGDKSKAFSILDRLQKDDGKSYDALLARGDLLREENNYKEAASAYTQALARIPEPKAEHWHIFYARGIAYERAQQWPKAEADLLKALALKPDQPEVMNYLGYSWLVHDTNLQRAKEMIAGALAQQPDNPAIIDSMGWVLYLEGDYEQARTFIEQALDMMPKDATLNDHLGDIYWRLGRETEAGYQWERALLFKPEEPGQKEALEKKLEQGLPPLKETKAAQTSTSSGALSARQ